MKRLLLLAGSLSSFAVLSLLCASLLSPRISSAKTSVVTRGPLVSWSSYTGTLEAKNESVILSRFRGNATVTELAPDGARVRKGEVLVRFDASALEREVLRLEKDRALAKSRLDSLVLAKIPIELRELQIALMEAEATVKGERRYAETLARYLKDGIVSEAEMAQQRAKVEESETKLATIEMRRKLTLEHKHPAEIQGAEAELASADQELKISKEQLANATVLAPAEGIVVYRMVNVGEGFRTVRVGDSIYPNLPFMTLAEMSDMVAHVDVPEEELSLVHEGMEAFVEPLAYAGTKMRGVVERVSSAAQPLPGQSGGRRFFHAVIGLEHAGPGLKQGMSVTVSVLSYSAPRAIKVPRVAVQWKNDEPFVTVLAGISPETRRPKLGRADLENFEVLSGLMPGEKVLLR